MERCEYCGRELKSDEVKGCQRCADEIQRRLEEARERNDRS